MSPIPPHFHTYTQKEDLAHALAASVAQVLAEQLLEQEIVSLAVSGGRTPERFFATLAAYPLAWSSIVITLVDERWVPSSSPRSNEALVRKNLLIDQAQKALFIPLHASHIPTPEEGCKIINNSLEERLPLPFGAVILGMGEDGHTASFFPGAENLSTALDMNTTDYVAPIRAEAAGEPRITLTLPTLLNTRHLFLHFEGEAKKAVYDQAQAEAQESCATHPIGVVLQHAPIRTQVFWCP